MTNWFKVGLRAVRHMLYRTDSFTKEHFDVSGVYLESSTLQGLIAHEDLARLAGGLKESRGTAGFIGSVISIVVSHDWFFEPLSIQIVRKPGQTSLKGATLFLSKRHLLPNYQGKGLGARLISIQLKAAAKLGCTEAIANASWSPSENAFLHQNGAYSYARFGFDAKLPDELCSKAGALFPGVTHVQDLMQTQEGRDFWLSNCLNIRLHFDLEPQSKQWAVLDSYTSGKHINTRGI